MSIYPVMFPPFLTHFRFLKKSLSEVCQKRRWWPNMLKSVQKPNNDNKHLPPNCYRRCVDRRAVWGHRLGTTDCEFRSALCSVHSKTLSQTVYHSRLVLDKSLHLEPLQRCSFSNISVTSPMSELILQPFRRFTYVTAHSPTLLPLFLRHRLFTYVTWHAAHDLYVSR